ncbi:MAG: response regulator transcription factor [Trueperaceae bacterium]|jgi:two-component system alkaline phosphatase synthesis response regulator PhoP|nr:response regulator transcription factor [Truepera sp.]HRN18903.1 response regulator transcription factor [Trueperaceae bacterium]HRQ09705.1 response regulator transcription factor [Trueperaceae bacterium]
MSAKVLVIEDEPVLSAVLADNLEAEGLAVVEAPDGLLGAKAWRTGAPDLVVLDVMLPHKDGYTLCRERRAAGDDTPVLFLSAKGLPWERVEGLEAGGDDYLAKPFHLPEFLLRVRKLLARSTGARRNGARRDNEQIEFGGNVVDVLAWTATLRSGKEVNLSEREMGVLRLLHRRADEVVSRDEILDAVWGNDTFPSSRTVDNFVMRLRRYFEPDPAKPVYFHTVWGVGYRFTPRPHD